ncbi:hypothetical protein HDV00_008481 [Rhizophlyctis rosea]|nr:hypothetical protein HDV00_008481 [Rhizophlyctis rosea]
MAERPLSAAPRQGQFMNLLGTGYTDTGGGDRSRWSTVGLKPVEIKTTDQAGAAYEVASTVEIGGPPLAGAGTAIADPRALTIKTGTVRVEDVSDGALIVDGGISSGKSVRCNEVILGGNAGVTLQSSSGGLPYTMILPQSPPSKDGQTVIVGAAGDCAFRTPAVSSVGNGGAQITGAKVWVGTAVTSAGAATFHPRSDGSATGDAFMSTILYAHATPLSDTDIVTASAFATRRSLLTDNRAIVFNVLTGAVVDAGGHTIQFAPDGLPVQALIVGL